MSRVAIVTGAGRGVGRSIAIALARDGWAVGLWARNPNEIAKVTSEISAAGGISLPVRCDVTDWEEVRESCGVIVDQMGPVDLLVNNAGSGMAIGPMWEGDPDEWWRDVEVNLRGTYLCSRALLPGMIARGRGRIVNVSSYVAIKPSPFNTAYGASKAAVVWLSESMARSVEAMGIYVFTISPGVVKTAITDRMLDVPLSKDWFPSLGVRTDDQWQSPELASRLVVLLASGQADSLSGCFVHVNDDIAGLIAQSVDVRARDLLTLRLVVPAEDERAKP
jgi:NAD(P)-dependent dehydrogenase (short-subunit alcohol dehydrogenase family)